MPDGSPDSLSLVCVNNPHDSLSLACHAFWLRCSVLEKPLKQGRIIRSAMTALHAGSPVMRSVLVIAWYIKSPLRVEKTFV
jgi:hypothetical protein